MQLGNGIGKCLKQKKGINITIGFLMSYEGLYLLQWKKFKV
jgi:hypothetical protein